MALTDEEVLLSLTKSRDNILALIEKITTNPKPSYNIDGQEVKWAEYLDMLMKQLSALRAQIQSANGPFEEESVVYV